MPFRSASAPPRLLWLRLGDHVTQGVERWRPDDRLDILKGFVNPERVGQAKEVRKFRDWIAHKNPRRRPSKEVDPASTYPRPVPPSQGLIDQCDGRRGERFVARIDAAPGAERDAQGLEVARRPDPVLDAGPVGLG